MKRLRIIFIGCLLVLNKCDLEFHRVHLKFSAKNMARINRMIERLKE